MSLQLPEIVSVGLYNAQIAHKRKSITENRKTSMFEIELPIENGGHSYIDKETQKITPNLLICAKPGQVRHTKLPFKCYYIHMIVTKGPLYDILMSIPNYITVQDSSEFARLFEQLYESHHSGIPENELLTHSLVLSLVYKLKQCTPLPATDYPIKHNHHVVIEDAIRYIRENLSSELSLALLAERANFSPIYFHNLFKTSTGQTTHEYIQQQHIAILKAELAKYIATESYIDRMGICNTIKAYLDNNDIAYYNQDTLANAVYVVVADEIEALRQCIIEYEVYVAEIAAMAPDYESILAQNTYYFIGIVQQMTTCISYVDIKPLFEKAESYYYGINVDTEEALEAAEIYAVYRDLIAYYEATAEIFIGYVTSLNAANDPSLSLVEKEDVIYVALSNAMAYASLVDEGVEGVAAAMAKYETALANYNAETEIVNSELAGATQITCATRSGYISATVLAIISKLFGN